MRRAPTAATHTETVLSEIKPGRWVDHYPAHGGDDRYRELITEVHGDILITSTGRSIHRSAVEPRAAITQGYEKLCTTS